MSILAAAGTSEHVWIAGLTALALVLSTTIPSLVAARRARADAEAARASAAATNAAIGTPNGHGDLATMLGTALENQGVFKVTLDEFRGEIAEVRKTQHTDGAEIRLARAQGESHALHARRWFRVLFEHAGVPPHVVAEYEAEARAADESLAALHLPQGDSRT